MSELLVSVPARSSVICDASMLRTSPLPDPFTPLTDPDDQHPTLSELEDHTATMSFDVSNEVQIFVGQAGFRGNSGVSALPEREYAHEASSRALDRASALTPLSPGAFQRVAP